MYACGYVETQQKYWSILAAVLKERNISWHEHLLEMKALYMQIQVYHLPPVTPSYILLPFFTKGISIFLVSQASLLKIMSFSSLPFPSFELFPSKCLLNSSYPLPCLGIYLVYLILGRCLSVGNIKHKNNEIPIIQGRNHECYRNNGLKS